MNKFRETIEKVKADDKLKNRIKAEANLINCVQVVQRVQKNKTAKKWLSRFRLEKITTIATVCVLAVVLTLGFSLGWFIGGTNGNDSILFRPGTVLGVQNTHLLSRNDFIQLIRSDASTPTPNPENEQDYTQTNNQIDGVAEGDIIQVDENHIFTLSRGGLTIVSVIGQMRVSFREEFENFFPDEMFILGDLLVVIGGEFSQFVYHDTAIGSPRIPWYGFRKYTHIILFNIIDRENVERLEKFSISGNFIASRLIDNNLVVATNYMIDHLCEESLFPKVNGEEINARYIHLHETGDFSSHLILASLSLNNRTLTIASHLGLRAQYSVKYFSYNNVHFFVGVNERDSNDPRNWIAYTHIIQINLNSLRLSVYQAISGHVLDRFWVSEYRNDLRVVSQSFMSTSGNKVWSANIFIFDNNLRMIGHLSNIAFGQRIHEVKLKGNVGVIRTYVTGLRIDLSNRTNPVIIQGMLDCETNYHLQFLSDNLALGLRRNTINGNGSIGFQGMQVALFENIGGVLSGICSISIGRYNVFSEALTNPHTILNDTERNMFSFPVIMQGNHRYPLSLYSQGLAVFEYDLNSAGNSVLVLKGVLTNISHNNVYQNWYEFNYDYFSFIRRGARIGNRIFTISDRFITSYCASTLQKLQQLRLVVDSCHFGHRWSSWSRRESSCTLDGYQHRHCLTCSYVEHRVQNALGHSFGSWQVTTAPSTTFSGYETRFCLRNGCLHYERRPLVNHVNISGMILRLDNETNSYHVRTFMGNSQVVNIPAYYNGVPITHIEDDVFFDNQTVRDITIGRNIEHIGANAFRGSSFTGTSNLTSVRFEGGSRLITIGTSAFENSGITSVAFPIGLRSIPNSLFRGARRLTGVSFEAGGKYITSIGNEAFAFTEALEAIEIPKNIISIGNGAFNGSGLNNIIIPDSVNSIGRNAFSFMQNLTTIHIPSSVTSIYQGAFSFSQFLAYITVSSENTAYRAIGNTLIRNFDNMVVAGTRISNIPSCAQIIGTNAFSGMGLVSIIIPSSIIHIHLNAFSDNVNLAMVFIEDGSLLQTIGNNAFANNHNLTSINLENALELVSIGNFAFWNVRLLMSINIPRNVTSIFPWAFGGWTSSQTINVYGVDSTLSAAARLGENWIAGSNARINYIE
ncbi:MAG: beta-propeller domain-containing protein [Firmicutes bacterium]|nr:beta-propeller domain-containing protein [Bacillota bacterium]